MPNFTIPLPLSLYIHIPWCVRKCPYCDFNSHALKGDLPQDQYVQALLSEFEMYHEYIQGRELVSIFFGGGTPSLFTEASISQILKGVRERVRLSDNIEITLEANPGTIDAVNFAGFLQAGVNRLSLGVQSFQNDKLKTLGRIHDADGAKRGIECAIAAGFSNFNLDLMYGLPSQTVAYANKDLETAIAFAPTHISWYQLTIEPNTLFDHHPPTLPSDEVIWQMQESGQSLLAAAGFKQYEVSAYAQENRCCQHNLNYWEFGDYLGIGAGAHSKITDHQQNKVVRFSQVKHPRDYLNAEKRLKVQKKIVSDGDLTFEFMLNAMRLSDGFERSLYTERTGLAIYKINHILEELKKRGLLVYDNDRICSTSLGKRFLNDIMMRFLNEAAAAASIT